MKRQYNNINRERNKKKEKKKKMIIYKKKCTGFGQPTRLMGFAQHGNKMQQDSKFSYTCDKGLQTVPAP